MRRSSDVRYISFFGFLFSHWVSFLRLLTSGLWFFFVILLLGQFLKQAFYLDQIIQNNTTMLFHFVALNRPRTHFEHPSFKRWCGVSNWIANIKRKGINFTPWAFINASKNMYDCFYARKLSEAEHFREEESHWTKLKVKIDDFKSVLRITIAHKIVTP